MMLPAVAQASNGLRTVAISGQAAPGTGVGLFSTFSPPVINDRGETAFFGNLRSTSQVPSTAREGIWSEGGGGGLKLLARQGSAAPGTPAGVTFSGLNRLEGPVINDAGHTAFAATISGAGVNAVNGTGIWSSATGTVAIEMRTGDIAPGTTDQFRGIGDNFNPDGVGLLLSNSGKIAFQGTLYASSNTTEGIWSGGGGTPLSLLARTGSPSSLGNAKFAYLMSSNGPVMNGLGQVAFHANMTNSSAVGAIWSQRGGNGLQLAAKTGDSAPGTAAGVVFGNFYFHPGQNDSGHIGFTASITGPGVNASNSAGVWSDSGGTLHLVARQGDFTPGGVPIGAGFSERVMNEKGEMAFVNENGIFSEGGGHGLRSIARYNQPVPNMPGVVFGGIDFTHAPILNGLGQTAFLAPLNGVGVTVANDAAIFAEDLSGNLRTIVREGSQIDVSDDPQTPILKTVQFLQFVGQSGNNDSRRSGMNDLGQVAFYALFTDSTAGVFVSDLVAAPVLATAGDFNQDGRVDGADYVVWRKNSGSAAEYNLWRTHFGETIGESSSPLQNAIPEPATTLSCLFAAALALIQSRNR